MHNIGALQLRLPALWDSSGRVPWPGWPSGSIGAFLPTAAGSWPTPATATAFRLCSTALLSPPLAPVTSLCGQQAWGTIAWLAGLGLPLWANQSWGSVIGRPAKGGPTHLARAPRSITLQRMTWVTPFGAIKKPPTTHHSPHQLVFWASLCRAI